MKKVQRLGVLCVCWWVAFTCNANEQSMLIDNGEYSIPAIVNVPQGFSAMPGVVMLHGMGGHKNEVGDLYLRLAARLAEQGIASIRIDFAGLGDSTTSHAKFTLRSATRDAKVALFKLGEQEGVNPSRMGVVGFSQGGLIAQLLVTQEKSIKSFVAWSAVAADGVGPFATIFEEDYLTALKEGSVVREFEWRSALEYSVHWFNQVKEQRALSQMSEYKGALLAIAGSSDEIVPPVSAINLIEASGASPSRAVIFKGIDHVFNVLNEGATDDLEVLDLTVTWLKDTL